MQDLIGFIFRMLLVNNQAVMEENIDKYDDMIEPINKIVIKKEPKDPQEDDNLKSILNRMVQMGDKVFAPLPDKGNVFS